MDLVRYGKEKLHFLTAKEYYEGHIDPENGADWNQTAPNDAAPALKDFEKAVNDCLVWKVSNLIRNSKEEDELSGKIITPFDERKKKSSGESTCLEICLKFKKHEGLMQAH